MIDLKINFFTESSPDSCTHHLSLSPLSESNQLVATLNTVADHLSVLLFLCLIFHNLQLAGASSGMVAVAAKQKRVTFHAVWLGK